MLVFSAPEKHNHELQARIRNSRKEEGKGWETPLYACKRTYTGGGEEGEGLGR